MKITHREIEVLDLISLGYTDIEIGKLLFLSHHTIRDHRRKVLQKLGMSNAASAVREAFMRNILPVNKLRLKTA